MQFNQLSSVTGEIHQFCPEMSQTDLHDFNFHAVFKARIPQRSSGVFLNVLELHDDT